MLFLVSMCGRHLVGLVCLFIWIIEIFLCKALAQGLFGFYFISRWHTICVYAIWMMLTQSWRDSYLYGSGNAGRVSGQFIYSTSISLKIIYPIKEEIIEVESSRFQKIGGPSVGSTEADSIYFHGLLHYLRNYS